AFARQVGAHHFQRQTLVERAMTGGVDRAHPALAEHRFDLVAAVDQLSQERIGFRAIADGFLQGIAVERAEPGVARKALTASSATPHDVPLELYRARREKPPSAR